LNPPPIKFYFPVSAEKKDFYILKAPNIFKPGERVFGTKPKLGILPPEKLNPLGLKENHLF